jgi:hypothetical protein
VGGSFEKELSGGLFQQLAGQHNRNIIGHLSDSGEVMCNEKDSYIVLGLQGFYQLQDLSLDGYIK